MTPPASNVAVLVQPTLMIGLGETGIQFLDLVRQRMPAGFEAGVTCLGLRTAKLAQNGRAQAPGAPGDANPMVITLKWNAEQARGVAGQPPGLEWYRQDLDAPHASGRLDGRMAFLMATYLQTDRRLEDRLRAVVSSLNINATNQLMVFIVASLREAESAFLGDLIDLLYTCIDPTFTRVLMPCLVLNDTRPNAPSRPGWAVAGLRELERFMLRGKQNALAYPPDWVQRGHEIIENGWFSHVLVVENQNSLPLLADQLTALLERDAATKFASDYCNVPVPGQFSVSASRSHTFWVPLEELRLACAVRLLRQELLGGGNNGYDFLAKIIQFLRGNPQNAPAGWNAFGWMADVLENKPLGATHLDVAPDTLLRSFNSQLESFLNNNYSASLNAGEQFLSQLDVSMESTRNPLSRAGNGGQMLANQMPGFRAVIRGYKEAIGISKKVVTNLDGLLEGRYQRIQVQLRAALQNATQGQTVYWQGSKLEDPIEPAYQQLCSQPVETWKNLLQQLRQVMQWQWVSPQGQQPYLRCLLNNIAHTEANTMVDPLLSAVYPLTQTVAAREDVFQYLGRLSANEITTYIENAPCLVGVNPGPLADRRTHEYLIGANDAMLNTWGLQSKIIQCQSNQRYRLTYLRLEYNLPAPSLQMYQADLQAYNAASPNLHVYLHEQNARQTENKYNDLCRNAPMGKVTAPIARLMHNERLFNTAMWCVFFDWIRRSPNIDGRSQWQVEIDKQLTFPLEIPGIFPANSLQDALINFILSIPCQDMGGLNPLTARNLANTLASLENAIRTQRNQNSAVRQVGLDNIGNRIDEWEISNDPFLQGLAVVQRILLAEEKKRRRKV